MMRAVKRWCAERAPARPGPRTRVREDSCRGARPRDRPRPGLRRRGRVGRNAGVTEADERARLLEVLNGFWWTQMVFLRALFPRRPRRSADDSDAGRGGDS